MLVSGAAHAGAVIFNSLNAATSIIALGVNDDGSLNTTDGAVSVNSEFRDPRTGLAYRFSNGDYRDGTSFGCFCEGWGVSTSSAGGHSGYANVSTDGGANNLTFGALIAGSSSAISTVSLTDLPGLSVVHSAAPSAGAPGALFEMKVKIVNATGAALNDVKYVRVLDWDVPLTETNEFVTIRGTATTSLLEFSNDQGFATANPLAANPTEIVAGTTNVDFIDSGPADHGAYFRFNFGTIANGDSYEFSIFFGATPSERTANMALAAVGAELYSLGQSSTAFDSQLTGAPATYIFGFNGVGGVTPPVSVPEPGSFALVSLSLLIAGALRRRQTATPPGG
jgi:type IV pilus assembly protein PilY1